MTCGRGTARPRLDNEQVDGVGRQVMDCDRRNVGQQHFRRQPRPVDRRRQSVPCTHVQPSRLISTLAACAAVKEAAFHRHRHRHPREDVVSWNADLNIKRRSGVCLSVCCVLCITQNNSPGGSTRRVNHAAGQRGIFTPSSSVDSPLSPSTTPTLSSLPTQTLPVPQILLNMDSMSGSRTDFQDCHGHPAPFLLSDIGF